MMREQRPGSNAWAVWIMCEFILVYHDVQMNTGLILGLRPANERHRYKVTPPLIVWVQT